MEHLVLAKNESGSLVSLFPSRWGTSSLLRPVFLSLRILNLISLTCYSYPITTTLGFNFRLALIWWIRRVSLLLIKAQFLRRFLPGNTPWYLAPLLRLIEFTSIRVRPITLCFRLLANIRAGHVLLTLMTKITSPVWVLGTLFGVLELLVCIVQAFVFLILVRVYLEEALTH